MINYSNILDNWEAIENNFSINFEEENLEDRAIEINQ